MQADAENTSDTDEDFFNALALLHSTEKNSVEKLRQMLDACIEKKYGSEKTLAYRMPEKFLQSIESPDNSCLMQPLRRHDSARKRRIKKAEDSDTISLLEVTDRTEAIANYQTADVEIYKVDYESTDDENIPRISIPDEGSVDGTVCKICNGAKLGHLILLECQECQETYHPLCHQPPVIDIGVYDPRFVWRCRQCVEIPSTISARNKIMEENPKIQRNDNAVIENETNPELKTFGKRDSAFFGKNDTVKKKNVRYREDIPLFAKDSANPSQRNKTLSSSMQLRKRTGSKLSITRITLQ